MGYAYTKKLIPWLIFPALTLFNVPPVRCDDGEFRDIVRNPLSDDELMQARRNAFSGDGESAYLVYMQLTAHELDLDARAYLRLAAELGYCMAVHEVRDSIRNQDGDALALRYIKEMKKNRRAKECFSNSLFKPVVE
jgi:hypothetical protein